MQQQKRPREIRPEALAGKPVRIVLVGGFLGAGKTTALAALAHSLAVSGLSTGFITNDQAPDLVDTATLRRTELPIAAPVEEVAGGCFCCRFDELIASAERVLTAGGQGRPPDVLLCEPVGSCTDMAATVLAPLRRYYPDVFTLAPFTVLIDRNRLEEMARLPASVRYIFEKQIEEADILALSKVDTLDMDVALEVAEDLRQRSGKPVLCLSALDGDGIDTWRDLLMGRASGVQALREIDYDLYAEGEAVLGWLNATASLQVEGGASTFPARALLRDIMRHIQRACLYHNADIAHLKMTLSGTGPAGDRHLRTNLTRLDAVIALDDPEETSEGLTSATLVVNARVAADPALLQSIVEASLQEIGDRNAVGVEILSLRSFRPGYPTPPYRIAAQ
jgi:Ni2+-binding GTPase involved in maturation of urease and hydrogenase